MSRKVNNNSINNIENLLTYLLNLLYYISIKKRKKDSNEKNFIKKFLSSYTIEKEIKNELKDVENVNSLIEFLKNHKCVNKKILK